VKALQHRIRQAAAAAHVNQVIVERDYAQGYVLFGIGGQAELGEAVLAETRARLDGLLKL
jgi:hypothetical protein